MELLTLPKMDAGDEHVFYVTEGAMLQLFGEDSYSVFMTAAFEKKVHSLAHMAVNDFVVFAVSEAERELALPLGDWNAEQRQSAMLEGMCVRRCLFPPIYELLNDNYRFILEGAIYEESISREWKDRTARAKIEAISYEREVTDIDDRMLRDTISDALNERFAELGEDPNYEKYLEKNEMTRKLQIDNMHRMFIHCEAFALKNKRQYVVGQTIGTAARRAYLQRQFPFITTIMKDYLTRDMVEKEEFTTCIPQYMKTERQ